MLLRRETKIISLARQHSIDARHVTSLILKAVQPMKPQLSTGISASVLAQLHLRDHRPINLVMNSLRIARSALRAQPTRLLAPVIRRGYAEAVSDKIKLSLALPHQVRHAAVLLSLPLTKAIVVHLQIYRRVCPPVREPSGLKLTCRTGSKSTFLPSPERWECSQTTFRQSSN